jgi:hypothetical protein
MPRRYTLVVLALGAMLACTGVYVHREDVAREAAAVRIAPEADEVAARESTPAERTHVAAHGPGTRTLAARVTPRMVLPPVDAPLAEELPALVRAARAGDVGAMCRLSFELNRCGIELKRARKNQESMMNSVSSTEKPADDWMIKMLAEGADKLAKLELTCAGVTPQPGLEPWRLLLDAARAGHVPSMVRFAAQPPLDRGNFLGDAEGWAAYGANSVALLQRAADGGDPNAVAYLYAAYRGRSVMGQLELLNEDPQRALAYGLLLYELSDEPSRAKLKKNEATLRAKLSPAAQRAAEQEAAHLLPNYSGRGTGINFEKPIPETPEECNQA